MATYTFGLEKFAENPPAVPSSVIAKAISKHEEELQGLYEEIRYARAYESTCEYLKVVMKALAAARDFEPEDTQTKSGYWTKAIFEDPQTRIKLVLNIDYTYTRSHPASRVYKGLEVKLHQGRFSNVRKVAAKTQFDEPKIVAETRGYLREREEVQISAEEQKAVIDKWIKSAERYLNKASYEMLNS